MAGAVTAMTWIFGLERLLGIRYTVKIRGRQVGEAGGVRKDWSRKERGKWKGPWLLRVSGNACEKMERRQKSQALCHRSLTARQGPLPCKQAGQL